MININRQIRRKRHYAYLIQICNILLALEDLEQKDKRRWWVRPINQKRSEQGAADHLVVEMRLTDEDSFFNFTRMDMSQFDQLLGLVGHLLLKQQSRKDVLPPKTRLLVTLRHLATGDSFKSLHFLFRIGVSTVRQIVTETCEILHETLGPIYLPPLTQEIMCQAAVSFENYCTYPNVWGAIDGKHIRIRAPKNSGTMFFNYKQFFSIVLMGVCDANLKFIFISVGGYGSESDGGIFRNCSLAQMLEKNRLQMPPPRVRWSHELPFVLVGDAAFPLKHFLMTPYSGQNLDEAKRNHNEILSKARTKIENAFGVLSARWQIFLRPMSLMPKNADKVTITCVLLHNFLTSFNSGPYITELLLDKFATNGNQIDGQYRQIIEGRNILQPIPSRFRLGSRNAAAEAINIRENIKNYLMQVN